MMSVEIVPGQALDVAAIMPVMNAAFDPSFGEAWTAAQCLSMLAMPGSQILLAKQSGQVSGFALARGVADEEELLLIAVEPGMTRKGIATQLVNSLANISRANHRRCLFIEVRANNNAIEFYRALGFEQIGRRPNYYQGLNGERFDAITMALNL